MKPRLSLKAKIPLWFCLNLLLLVAAGWITLRLQVNPALDSFLSGYVGQRVEPTVQQLLVKLGEVPEDQWTPILQDFSKQYGVDFGLFNNQQQQIAGTPVTIPDELVRRLPHGPRRPPGAPEEDRLPRPGNGEPNGQRPPGPAENDAGHIPIHQRFMLRTTAPEAYWVGLYGAVHSEGSRGRPIVIVMRSATFSGHGFFFDYRPWILAGGGIVLLSVLLWLPLVLGITRAISQMTGAAEKIAVGDFETQVDARRSDELGQLADSINQMSTRLKGLVQGQKRFLGDIAHELCAPISRIQMALGILEQRADDKQKAYVEDLREEIQHMSSLVNELLSFSRASLQERRIELRPLQLLPLVSKVIQRESSGTSRFQINVPENLQAIGEPDFLARALSNLIRNAIRYAGDAGPIVVTAVQQDKHILLTVTDSGPGVPAEALQMVFDPFYRVERSRSRMFGGVGLGLAIVKSCIEACQGTVTAQNRTPSGLQVNITLQAA